MTYRRQNARYLVSLFLSLALGLNFWGPLSIVAYAKDSTVDVYGKYFEFDTKTQYTNLESASSVPTSGKSFGSFSVTGDFSNSGTSFSVNSDVLSFCYSFDQAKLMVDNSEWHLVDSSTRKVNTLKLDNKIKSGALILETSLDGDIWIKDVEMTDVFTTESLLLDSFYTTKDIQQQNGCYYRLTVAYDLERVTESRKVAFVTVEDKQNKRVAEVYEFYVVNEDTGNISSANDIPRKELGTKVKTGKDNGFSGTETIDKDDPHYGWDLGVFTINGYTRETKNENGTPIFLKNVGDKVVLWFTLKHSIDTLNGDSALSIAEDTGTYDQYFEIAKTDFGRGTLIIQQTDYQGVKHDPIVYTNYLAANTMTGADTRVQLFEEGDYEVSLDYEIMSNPRQIAGVSIVPTYTNYKNAFSFSIRNGNCMVYPFDIESGNELSDKAITADGFRLDMAKSRYLTIDVEKKTIKVNADGTLVTDTRFSRPAKDDEAYAEEGIYTFTVKNLYSGGNETTKTIYVGTNRYYKSLSQSGMLLDELNALIVQGSTVEEDGTIVEPVIEEPAIVEEPSPSPSVIADAVPATENEGIETTQDNEPESNGSSGSVLVLIAGAVVVTVVFVYFLLKKKS